MKLISNSLLARRARLGKRSSILGGLAAASVAVIVGTVAVVASFAANEQLYLSPATGSVLDGNTISVAIRVNSGTDPVNAVQANLSYDPTKLQFVSVDSSGTAFGLAASSITNTAGSIQLARGTNGGDPAVTGDNLFATVVFKALAGSGDTTVSIASGSHVVRATDAVDILTSSAGATYTLTSPISPTPTPVVTPTPGTGSTPTPAVSPTPAPTGGVNGTLSLAPATIDADTGSDVTVEVHEDSGTTEVNAIQADLAFDATKLQYVSTDATGSDFPLNAVTATGSGTVKLTRALNGGDPAVTGSKLVAKVTFKVLAADGTAAIDFLSSSVISTLQGTNDLKTSTGSVVTVTSAGTVTPSPTPAPVVSPTPTPAPASPTPTPRRTPTPTPGSGGTTSTPTPTDTPLHTATPSAVTPAPPAVITPMPPSPVSTPAPIVTIPIVGARRPLIVSGTTKLTAPSIPATSPVTYAIDNKLAGAPVIDTTTLDNGTHTVTATTTDPATGATQEVSQKIKVNNTQPLWKTLIGSAKTSWPYLLIIIAVLAIGVGLWLFMRKLTDAPAAPLYADGVRSNLSDENSNKPGSGPVGPLGF